jgi:hypothetical protein
MTNAIKKYMSKIGKKGGSMKSTRKTEAARANFALARQVKADKHAPALPVQTEGGI